MIKVFDAFAGIGGFRSAFERVGGFKIVAWCEIDHFAQKSYRALYDTGGEDFYENIRDIDVGGLKDFDLLVGGFPCQPYSVCGKRQGLHPVNTYSESLISTFLIWLLTSQDSIQMIFGIAEMTLLLMF